jgi:glutamine synthetase
LSEVLVFGGVIDKRGAPYNADIRGVLKSYAETLNKKDYTLSAANEIEDFLFKGSDAERRECYADRDSGPTWVQLVPGSPIDGLGLVFLLRQSSPPTSVLPTPCRACHVETTNRAENFSCEP